MVFFETDTGEFFKINRKTGLSFYRHNSGLLIQMDTDGNLIIDNEETETGDVDIRIKGNLNISVGGNFNIEAVGTGTLKSIDTTIEGTAFLRMKFPQGAQWFPNVLPNDPASGAPHGGVSAGLTTLLSESSI